MKKTLLILAAFVLVLGLSACGGDKNDNEKPIVAVTIVPQATFVEAIAGDLVEVITIIPPGSSPASYEPTPKQMVDISDAIAYFTIGVPAEEGNILPQTSEDLNIVDLVDAVNDVYPDLMFEEDEHEDDHEEDHEEDHEGEDGHDHSGRDPHIWLSLKRVKVMVAEIKDELIRLDPDNEATYIENYNAYIAEITDVQEQAAALLASKTVRSFIVYHPSWGYLADDFDLEMIALEEDGSEASASRIQEVIDFALENNIDTVFFQSQIHSSQVESLVDELNADQIEMNPLASNYLENYLQVITSIADSLE